VSDGYAAFLGRKVKNAPVIGREISTSEVHPMLHPWQRRIVTWAVQLGRAAIWADTGTGKTVMMIEYGRLSGDRCLIIAPLAVCHQTVREAAKLGVDARYVRSDEDADGPGIWVTNYEMALRFDPDKLDVVILDEASILKQSDGRTRMALTQHFAGVRCRLACTATPAPNESEELTNQAEFVGVMPRAEMLAAYFVHDDEGWRVKGHARKPMFRWMASWAVALRHPSDIGGDDTGYILPGYDVIPHLLPVDAVPDGQLFATDLGGVGGRAAVRKATLDARCQEAARLVLAEPGEPWIIWCGLNAEADLLAKLIPGAVNVHGAMTPEEKAAALLSFADQDIRVIITKTSIASFGMNWQHCARMAFCGLSDSFESMYQAIRRCHRYGQPRRVRVHIVLSELEGQIAENVARKERQATEMTDELVREMRTAGELRMT
jgi:Helicase conserved C-terminal domain